MTVLTNIGSTLTSNKVYYECRQRRKPSQRSLGGEIHYQGKLNSRYAFCVDAAQLYNVENIEEVAERNGDTDAIRGRVISYSCVDNPKEPSKFQRTHSHRGVKGYLSDRVVCVIDASLYAL